MPRILPFDIAADLDTPVSAYLKLRPFGPRFLLESVEQGVQVGRYSFIGFGDCLEVRLDRRGFAIGRELRPRPADCSALLAGLREALARAPRPRPAIAGVPFDGGLVGYSAYDLARSFETLPDARHGGSVAPDACYIAPKSVLVFDHLTRGVSLMHDGSEHERRALKREIVAALAGPLLHGPRSFRYAPARASMASGEFGSAVRRVKAHITAGDVYQLVLSVRFDGECDLDPFTAYRALRLLNPSPYMYYFEAGGVAVAGSSPEALVKLNGRHAALRPIAGTRPRGRDARHDEQQAKDLLADAKESAEHVMLVDLARNDLGRVAAAGTIQVDPFRQVERYSHVMHIVSGVGGELAPGCDAFDLFAAAFPAGTLTGAPKVRAMQIIDGLEPVGRGLYGGTVGYFAHGGNMDQAITIRTLVFGPGGYSYQAGAGIVADSVPDREHFEVIAKGAVLRRAMELAGAGL